MEVVLPKLSQAVMDKYAKLELLNELETKVKSWIESHISKSRYWFSSDFLPSDEKNNDDHESVIKSLRNRAKSIADPARVAIAINLLTEEGLPHFHRLIAQYLGDNTFWSKWNNLWTAEEDRHGAVLRDYVRDARLFNFKEIELMQFAYMNAGFNPDWKHDPYRIFVYTSLQERATQVSHKNTGKAVENDEPLLSGILSSIAADEAKHYTFYRNVFKSILERDTERALVAAAAIMPSIDMPGLTVPNFRDIADVVRRQGIYTPWDYIKIVEELIKFWEIELISGLTEIGAKAQEKILLIPQRLKKAAEYIELRTYAKTFSFEFVYNRIIQFD